jgi:fumarate hydratase subunit beta
MRRISTPLTKEIVLTLKAGDEILLSGILYTARDVAHQRLFNTLKNKSKLPIPLKDQIIYYVGPTPARPKKVIGSSGPTTSARMDEFTPLLLKMGVRGMIGKGKRSAEVIKTIKKYKAVYFLAIGGAGALLSTHIEECWPVAYYDLGPEAIYKLKVKDFPVIVGIDWRGNDIYKKGEK